MRKQTQVQQNKQFLHYNQSFLFQQQISMLPQLEFHKLIYELAEENPYLAIRYTRWSDKVKQHAEYQEEILTDVLENNSIPALDELKEELLFMGLNAQEKWVGDIIISSILPSGMVSIPLKNIAEYTAIDIRIINKVFQKIQTIAPILEFSESPVDSILKIHFPADNNFRIAKKYWNKLQQLISSNKQSEKKTVAEMMIQDISDKNSIENIQFIIAKVDNILENLIYTQSQFEQTQIQQTIIYPDYSIFIDEETHSVKVEFQEEILLEIDNTKDSMQDKKYYQQAKNIINSMDKRSQFLKDLGNIIFQEQFQFLTKINPTSKPKTQKSIAQELGVHPSTVSRTVNNKYYILRGEVKALKDLLQRGVGVGKIHPDIIKQEIQKILQLSQGVKITDSALQKILASKNILIARRTVNKYRRDLN